MLGWGVPTYDSASTSSTSWSTPARSDIGTWNGTGYSNPELDAKIRWALASETDLDARNADDRAKSGPKCRKQQIYLPDAPPGAQLGDALEGVGIEVSPEDDPKMKFFTMK